MSCSTLSLVAIPIVEEACKLLKIEPNTRSKDCSGCNNVQDFRILSLLNNDDNIDEETLAKDLAAGIRNYPTLCDYHYFAMQHEIERVFRFMTKEAVMVGRTSGNRLLSDNQKLTKKAGELLLRWHSVFLDMFEEKMKDNYKYFTYHGKLSDFSFTMSEIEEMSKMYRRRRRNRMWPKSYHIVIVHPSETLPLGCIYWASSNKCFCMLFSDGTFFVLSYDDDDSDTDVNEKTSVDEHLDNIRRWKEDIIKWQGRGGSGGEQHNSRRRFRRRRVAAEETKSDKGEASDEDEQVNKQQD